MSIKTVWLASLALALLAGCAGMNVLRSEVSTFGPWPAGRQPASFAFERLPSQQQDPSHQQQLEDAARGALEAVGFRAAPDLSSAEYLVQLSARVVAAEPWITNDPLFWHGGWRYGGPGRWNRGPLWGLDGGWTVMSPASFEREVALLIRDRKTGQLLYEARAGNEGQSPTISSLLPAMFAAALKDFPAAGPNPRTVTTPISTP